MNSQDAWVILVLVVGAGFLGWQGYRSWKRTREMRALGARLAMDYAEDALPNSLQFDGTSLANAHAVRHVVDGVHDTIRIVAFDCRLGWGRGSWEQTVIAVECGKDIHQALSLSTDYMLERSGGWQLFFEPSGRSVMPIEELEAHIKNVESVLKN